MKKFILLGLVVLFIGCPSAPKNSARIYIERGEYERAKEQILIGLKEDPNDYELYALMAKAEIGLSQWIAASEAFQDAIAIDSVSAMNWLLRDKNNIAVYWQAFYNAAVSLLSEKKYEPALKNLRFCEHLDSQNVDLYILRGGIYAELDNTAESKRAYNKALSIDPENPEAYFLVGKALFEKKEYDSSLVKFNDAIKYFEIRYNRIAKVVFQNLPEVDKPLGHKIIQLWRGKKDTELDELVKVKLGFDAGLNAMRGNIERFFKTSEGLTRSYYLRGMAYYNLKNETLALENLLKSLDFIPEDLDALFYTGELLIRSKKYNEAIGYFERITQLKDDDLFAWFYIAVSQTQLKKFKEAIDIYEGKVLVIDPKNIDAMTNLAYCYREIGNNKKALEYLMKADQLQKEQQ